MQIPGTRHPLASPSCSSAVILTLIIVCTIIRPHVWAAESRAGAPTELPTEVDLRPAFEQMGLDRRQQGSRPTCSVFTVVGALEFALSRPGQPERLSVEFLNWAGNQAAGVAADGGFFSDLWSGFEKHGICPETLMPYRREFDPEKGPGADMLAAAREKLRHGLKLNWLKEWDVRTGLTEAQFRCIKETLAGKWPVCAGLRWPKTERWDEGVLGMCGPEAVRDGHSVLLVGYRDDARHGGGGVFIFRNSNNGGRDGFMTYEYARAYMNDALWIATAHPGAASVGKGTAPQALWPAADPLAALAAPRTGRNRRVSSNQQPDWKNANMDMTLLPPGKACEMPLLNGPGMINHMWFTSHAGRVNELNSLTLRIYWDGRAEPGVEAPLGEFFAVGQGQPAEVNSFPVQVSPSGSLSCYWKMPFAKSARIVVSNDNPDRTAGLYWQIDYVELEGLPAETPYFYARYRQEYPARAGDYVVADLSGSGHFVGAVLSVTLGQDGWWGEGDDFFYVDGEAVPSLQGTGSEDYFNDAWGFRPRLGLWFGQPRWQGDRAGDSGVGYRWHILDPVVFQKSLRFEIEHKGNHEDDTEGFYVERPDFLNSVAFWYQTGVPKAFGQLPPYPERRVPWQQHHLVRAFKRAKTSDASSPQVQFAGMFGARPVLGWAAKEPEGRLTLPFSVKEEGRYAVRLTAGTGPGYGAYEVSLDGKVVAARADFQAREYDELDLALGTHALAVGQHELAFKPLAVAGDHSRPLALELLRLLKLPPEARRELKNHNEAHFIRLGIGRAVYAYRLAYDELPESLEALVKVGLLPARYLLDQNRVPLKARREGGAFLVESTGPEPWQHSWQGLDARR